MSFFKGKTPLLLKSYLTVTLQKLTFSDKKRHFIIKIPSHAEKEEILRKPGGADRT